MFALMVTLEIQECWSEGHSSSPTFVKMGQKMDLFPVSWARSTEFHELQVHVQSIFCVLFQKRLLQKFIGVVECITEIIKSCLLENGSGWP